MIGPPQTDSISQPRIDFERTRAILDERDRQDDMWGTQEHDLEKWIEILRKQLGDLTFAVKSIPRQNWRKEAIQVAAVALAMVEQTPEEV